MLSVANFLFVLYSRIGMAQYVEGKHVVFMPHYTPVTGSVTQNLEIRRKNDPIMALAVECTLLAAQGKKVIVVSSREHMERVCFLLCSFFL